MNGFQNGSRQFPRRHTSTVWLVRRENLCSVFGEISSQPLIKVCIEVLVKFSIIFEKQVHFSSAGTAAAACLWYWS
jgi:hypothetical protein